MKAQPMLEANLPEVTLFDRGKVRDVFEVGENLLSVATDRIFAFDRVYPGGIPGKGRVLTACTIWAFEAVKDLVGSFVISSQVEDFPPVLQAHASVLIGRSLLVKKVETIRVECVVRGFLYGQAWQLYRKGEFFWGCARPPGLKLAQELSEPIFTPASKVRSGADENIDFSDLALLVGEERATAMKDLSLKLYRRLRAEWEKRGFILADTKFEFGLVGGRMVLINEASTPDCSRFWKQALYRPGHLQDSWDRDLLEHYLHRKRWSPQSPPVPISGYIRRKLEERFRELASLL